MRGSMKTINGFLQKLWDAISDPRLRKPLMILTPCLALILAILLWAALLREGSGRRVTSVPLPEATAAVIQVPEATPEPALAPEPAEAVIVEEPAEAAPSRWRVVNGETYYELEDGSHAVGLREIDGELYYFNKLGVKGRAVGIDVSFYDGNIDWRAVKAHGVDFAIIRVGCRGWTSGEIYGDSKTQEYLHGARAAGIPIGVYFYSTAVNRSEAVEEARMTLEAVGGIPLDYPIFIDMEFSGEYPRGRSDRLSPSERVDIAVAFGETVRGAGYEAGVYASQNYFKASIDYRAISGYTIWLASYTRDDKLPNFSKHYDIWQFSDRGRVDGIAADVDMNVIY